MDPVDAESLRGEGRSADTQAAIVLAVVGALATMAVDAHPVGWAAPVWRAGLYLGACAAALLGAAIFPRTPRRTREVPPALLCAWDVVRAERAGILTETHAGTRQVDQDRVLAAQEAQLLALARIVVRKYALIRAGLLALACSGLLCAAAVVAG